MTTVSDEGESTSVETTIERVCVFRQGAEVTRRASVPAGTRRVAIHGLPLCLDDGTVRVRVEGGVHATGVRVSLEASGAEHGPNLAPAEDAELSAAQLAMKRWRAERAVLRESIEAWKRLAIPARAIPRDGAPGPSPHGARLALAEIRSQRLEALHQELAEVVERGRELTERLEVLEDRRRRDTQARERAEHELRKAVWIDLDARPSKAAVVFVSYEVPGARWAPSYVLRIDEDADEARLEMRAMVAQRTGEDWTSVELALSTASPARFVDVPELRSQRIGRAQRRARDRGWRPPPADTATLLEDYARARRSLSEVEPAPTAFDEPEAAEDDVYAEFAVAGAAMPPPGMGPPPPPGAPPAAMGMPVAASLAAQGLMMEDFAPRARSSGLFGGGAAKARRVVAEAKVVLDAPAPTGPDDDWLDYGRLRMPAPRDTAGHLAAATWEELYIETLDVEIEVVRIAMRRATATATDVEDLGPRFAAPEPEDAYDYAYASDAPVDVPADGAFHNVPVRAATTSMSTSLIVVPRASTDAYRQGELDNPLHGPLLAGPADVYVGRDFLTSTRVRFTPPGGKLRLGLGVAQGLKVARNARFHETSAGLMGGSTVLHHDIDIELRSHLGRPHLVEVRERVPVLRDKEDDIKLTLREVTPAWETYDPSDAELRGGHRWRFTVAPEETKRLHFGYDIRIASKNELLGGNRRED